MQTESLHFIRSERFLELDNVSALLAHPGPLTLCVNLTLELNEVNPHRKAQKVSDTLKSTFGQIVRLKVPLALCEAK